MVHYVVMLDADCLVLLVQGHASEYAEHNGKNIVCAAVSTICDMAAAGCTSYDPYTTVTADKGKFYLTCRKLSETMAILKSAKLELDRLKENYPYCFGGEADVAKNNHSI